MNRLMVFGLLAVLFLGTCMSLSANTLEENFVRILSSSTPSNFIDHLPFIINTTDVYYITKDLTVNGNGITILANNTVLIGQGHTIAGYGTGIAVNISASNVALVDCIIENFTRGIRLEKSIGTIVRGNRISNNTGTGIYIKTNSFSNTIENNLVINNWVGILLDGENNRVCNNFICNNGRTDGTSYVYNHWNGSKMGGSSIIGGLYKAGNYWGEYTGIDTDGDGIGDTDLPYTSGGTPSNITYGGDYLPLVDIFSPKYDLEAFNSSSPSTSLSITWKDNVQLDKVILQLDGVNYTNSAKVSESFGFNEFFQVEHKATFASFFVLPIGPHTYRWYANDTSNHWNSTHLQSFNVIQTNINSIDISSTLKVSANITCQGTSNITEEMDTVDLDFSIDGTWYSEAMAYSPSTKLYSALIPEYNQLANKTIMIYVAAKTKQNQFLNSDIYIYHVPQWVAADLNRDGKVTILDIVKATSQYGQPYP